MEVTLWRCLIIAVFVSTINGEEKLRSSRRSTDDTDQNKAKGKDKALVNTLDFLKKPKPPDEKDYFLPPAVFPNNEEEEEDDDDDGDRYDYDYDKEFNYKDAPDSSTVKSEVDHPVSIFDDKITLHTTKDNLPVFLLEPENTYVVKNKPATLKCRAANALEVYYKCNGIKIQSVNFELVDPHNGVRIIDGEHNVTKQEVDEYFGPEKYQCSCFAWTSRGHIRSQPAFVELAYIKKQFSMPPRSQLVRVDTQVSFHCEPPPAAPFVQVYWLKNDVPVAPDDNVAVERDGTLVIKHASLLDMANYTCVAENIAGKRLSEPALLTVFVNGGWTPWSAWADCSCPDQRSRGKRRVRSCTAPRPLNGGQPCVGSAIQKTPDCLNCDLDMYVDGLDELVEESADVMLGRWSQWSEWSICDSDCLQTRRRKCLSTTSCPGKDYQVAQCPMCVRTSKSNFVHDGSSYWLQFMALLVALLIFIIVVLLGIKYLKLKLSEPYTKSQPGSNYIGSVIKRTLTNQPDLTIHEEFQTMDSRRTHRLMSTSTHTNHQEHLYEVPQLSTSYMSPIDQEVRNEGHDCTERTYACKDAHPSDQSDSSCFLSSGSSYCNESLEMSPSLKNNVSIDSKILRSQNDTAVSKIVTKEGSWLNIRKCGVDMFVPDNTVEDEELFSIEITDEEWNRPLLQEGEAQLSPVIRCSPKSMHFRKSVVLSFPHYACLKNGTWVLSILQKPEEINTREWRKVLTLGQETPGTPLFAQVDPGKVFLVSEFLSDFVLVGRSFSGLDAKALKLVIFVSKRLDNEARSYNLKVHVLNDTPYAFYECAESERRAGATLLCDPKTIYFQEGCSDLCVHVRELGPGWHLRGGDKHQELPYTRVWNMNAPLQCNFVLQQTDSINCLELNMSIYQTQSQASPVIFNLKTNDLNFNFGSNVRYSATEMGHSVNILENPFNYSSLSKKEGRYDFVYKNGNSYRSSNVSSDNNYRTNILSKSDRVILCKLLDSHGPKGNDWRLLAEKLKLNCFYYYFSNTCSPTENILNLWLCRNNETNMLMNLARIFREMGRVDCATVVERRCFPN